MQFRKLFTKQLGFTMVELLVVIAIIGILATAVLAALNPIEQIRKGNDAARQSDAKTIIDAIDRFQAAFGCYPWKWSVVNNLCNASVPTTLAENGTGAGVLTDETAFASTGVLYQLMQKQEIKSQFLNRADIVADKFWLSVNSSNQVSVCFEPESTTGRGGSLGPLRNSKNATTTPAVDCSTAYTGTAITATNACAVCFPQ